MVEVTIHGEDIEQVKAKMLSFLGLDKKGIFVSEVDNSSHEEKRTVLAPTPLPQTEPAAEVPKATKKTKATGVSATKKVEPETETKTTQAITRDQIQQALASVNSKKGFQTARKVLAQFGAQRISEIQPEAYPQFVEACKQATV